MRYLFIMLCCLGLSREVKAQIVKGTVVDENMDVLVGANVYWINTSIGTATNRMGDFELTGDNIEDKRVIISYLGYQNDTVRIKGNIDFLVEMKPEQNLQEIVIEGKQSGAFISSSSPEKLEVINQVELGKAACCDLAGCFNTTASVEPNTTNVITNAKELRILGLSGIYNQLLLDGNSLFQGLSYTYGVSSVPGPMVNSIFVSKGTNSVLQGAESITGQINVILQEPTEASRLFLNAFMNTFWEKQFNAYSGFKLGKVDNLLGGHLVLPASKWDRNDDTFLDLPQLTRIELIDKWSFQSATNPFSNKGGIRWTNEKREGGQMDFDSEHNLGSNVVYGQNVEYQQMDVWDRSDYQLDEQNSIGLILSGQWHDQNSWYGETNYRGQQLLFNAVLQYEFKYNLETGSHLRTGLSYKNLNIDEDITFSNPSPYKTYGGKYLMKEILSGAFVEHTFFSKNNKITWLLGLRADHHNQFGWFYSPRTLLKFTPKEKTDIRLSIGNGWHTPKVFSEQAQVLASQRDIHFHGQLEPDKAWNYGINITQKFELSKVQGTFTADFYQTRFSNHVMPHYHTVHDAIVFENNKKPAVGNGFQIEVTLDLWDWVSLKNAYNYLDIQHTNIEGEETSMNFITKHRFLTSFSLAPIGQNWHLDLDARWMGRKHLPSTTYYPTDYQQGEFSVPYTLFNAQFTYKWKTLEWYVGCENILGFVQENPIISWENPFSEYFDTSFAWGPTRGREGYIGLRYTLE